MTMRRRELGTCQSQKAKNSTQGDKLVTLAVDLILALSLLSASKYLD